MSHVVVNPEVDLRPRPGDETLPGDILGELELFRGLKKQPSFEKFPGSTVLRHYRPGEVICRQGESGASAFYILTTADLLAVRQAQLRTAEGQRQTNLARQAAELEARLANKTEGAARVATAHLLLSQGQARPPQGLWNGLKRLVFGGGRNGRPHTPDSIAIDGASDIDFATRQAPMLEGEVFGEMSCMTLSPRSATVVADVDCYLLEFLRNIFDHLQRDAGYQQRIDAIYRERVLANHLRRLEILSGMEERDLELLRDRAELVRAEPGHVICDEGDPSDSVYLVRSGLVQVVKSQVRLRATDVADWPALANKLLEGKDASATEPLGHLWQACEEPARAAISRLGAGEPQPGDQAIVLSALNERLRERIWLAAKSLSSLWEQPDVASLVRQFPKGLKGLEKDWTDLEVRAGGRALLHVLLAPSLGAQPAGPPRVLSYLSRGEIFGEMGVLLMQPRSATCVAYDHPPDPKRKSMPVDLVRIPAELFHEFIGRTPVLKQRVEALIAERQTRDARRAREQPWEAATTLAASDEFQELGLVQGQKLLLVDLHRCTRCGECVQACIDTHSDGRSRLYLDGPRFDRYLVPSACRKCLDPACMIGCPVGSIQRGDDGQILIRDWCIGCGVCADQCPYDSIQMHDLGLVPLVARGWRVSLAAAATKDWHLPRGRDEHWPSGTGPFDWNLELQSLVSPGNGASLGATLTEAVCLRYTFDASASARLPGEQHQLSLVTQGSAVEVWLNGERIELESQEKQRRGENKKLVGEATIPAERLRRTGNVVAVRIEPPVVAGDRVLELRVLPAPEEIRSGSQTVAEVKQVAERAVVCDLCHTLPTGPACVSMCPHEAAFRMDARSGFPGG